MNCDCIERVEGELADHLRERAGDDVKAECQDKAICFGSQVTSEMMIRFRVKGSKKGFTSAKGMETSVKASFCPFCGKSTKPEPVSPLAANPHQELK